MALITVSHLCNGRGTFVTRVVDSRTAGVHPSRSLVVGATICEYAYGNRFMGTAQMQVMNVVPGYGYVDVRCYVGWNSPLWCELNLILDIY